ncbi:hypothetical protein ACCT04_35195, partial [Rhizobium ruizarguesonis]
FSDKVAGFRKIRIFGKPTFDLKFVKSVVVKGAEFPCQPAQRPDESELRTGEIYAKNCPENFENRAALVGAEIARLEGREIDAVRLYEQA